MVIASLATKEDCLDTSNITTYPDHILENMLIIQDSLVDAELTSNVLPVDTADCFNDATPRI